MDPISATIKLFVALLCGGIIGIERERERKAAGLRTHILVCMGATIFMIVSLYMGELYPGTGGDRIAAQVVTGIGFLGAGAIMKMGKFIVGLTTAASIWISSAIGLAIGCDFYLLAVLGTFLAFFTLRIIPYVENYVAPHNHKREQKNEEEE